MAIYVPRILLCGDAADFRKIIGDKPAEIVGQINFQRTDDKTKLFFDGQDLTGNDLRGLLDGTAEYLIFTDAMELYYYLEDFPQNTQVMSATAFSKKIRDGFFSNESLAFLQLNLNQNFSGRVLDFDCYLAKSDLHTRGEFNTEFDCLAENFSGGFYPFHENIYGKIYRTFDECKFHHFDGILLTVERTPEEFADVLIKTEHLSENIWAFVRKNSALETWLIAAKNLFADVKSFPVRNGAWCLLKKRVSPADLKVYVVTHKDVQLSALPDGYRIIHAGHARSQKDFGYIGDDTGDNISRLNPFLDEITALYWIWKNTRHTYTGIVHYRRFFTGDTEQKTFDAEKILSSTEILKLLDEYDIIVHEDFMTNRTQLEVMIYSTGSPELVDASKKIIHKHLARTHPDYLDGFNEVMNGFMFFLCGIHVTRRNIFDAYCEWLFSFILDATAEMRKKIIMKDKPFDELPHIWSRMPSFFAERLLTVWLMKNHLRIKTLPIMFRDDV